VGRLRIELQNRDDSAIEYLSSLGSLRADGEALLLSNFRGDASDVNHELMKRGYKVSSISLQPESLEDFFFKLIGEAH
jgi:hypothetical protein